ncbi:MAG: hypothetical protein K2Q07_10270 [Burkholderiaceae bacterium]|nr:hypothetical protein [Burkholderiaceae bacterium]
MHAPKVQTPRSSVNTAVALAHLLERIDRSGDPIDGAQYQIVVSRLKNALNANLPDTALAAVLNTYPSTAELYENMHYERSGLSRSSLESAVSAEMQTAELLDRLALHPRTRNR